MFPTDAFLYKPVFSSLVSFTASVQCSAIRCSSTKFGTLQCNVVHDVQCSAIELPCNALQCSVVQCSVLANTTGPASLGKHWTPIVCSTAISKLHYFFRSCSHFAKRVDFSHCNAMHWWSCIRKVYAQQACLTSRCLDTSLTKFETALCSLTPRLLWKKLSILGSKG